MLVACQLADLSALGAGSAGVKWRAMRQTQARDPGGRARLTRPLAPLRLGSTKTSAETNQQQFFHVPPTFSLSPADESTPRRRPERAIGMN